MISLTHKQIKNFPMYVEEQKINIDPNSIIELYLQGNNFEGFKFLSQFPYLQILDLADCQICSTEQLPLANLQNVQQLNLANNSLQSLQGVNQLTNLTVLDITGNPLMENVDNPIIRPNNNLVIKVGYNILASFKSLFLRQNVVLNSLKFKNVQIKCQLSNLSKFYHKKYTINIKAENVDFLQHLNISVYQIFDQQIKLLLTTNLDSCWKKEQQIDLQLSQQQVNRLYKMTELDQFSQFDCLVLVVNNMQEQSMVATNIKYNGLIMVQNIEQTVRKQQLQQKQLLSKSISNVEQSQSPIVRTSPRMITTFKETENLQIQLKFQNLIQNHKYSECQLIFNSIELENSMKIFQINYFSTNNVINIINEIKQILLQQNIKLDEQKIMLIWKQSLLVFNQFQQCKHASLTQQNQLFIALQFVNFKINYYLNFDNQHIVKNSNNIYQFTCQQQNCYIVSQINYQYQNNNYSKYFISENVVESDFLSQQNQLQIKEENEQFVITFNENQQSQNSNNGLLNISQVNITQFLQNYLNQLQEKVIIQFYLNNELVCENQQICSVKKQLFEKFNKSGVVTCKLITRNKEVNCDNELYYICRVDREQQIVKQIEEIWEESSVE